ncbi:MAG: hypothetical protein JWR80_2889 [Bradyrhizobium sp.]|nr:hypothetical protein [Bradyrhizobium sp.]
MPSKLFSAVKGFFTSSEVSDRAQVVEDVLFGKTSGTDADAVLAVANLTTSLCNNKCTATVDAGLFVFFKAMNEAKEFQIFYKRLTVRERTIINERPTLLKDPHLLLENLEHALALSHERAAALRVISLADRTTA